MDISQNVTGFAIVGMAGRFPKAPDIAALWRLLLAGGDGITRFAPDEIEDAFDPVSRADANYVAARPILEDIDQFDADFFAMLPRDAALTDPQQRVLLECAWHALEDAGCDPARYPGTIGVFAGSSLNSYFLRHVCPDRAALERFTSEFQVGAYQELLGTLHDFVATRIAYKLDLKGPAIAMQSACSTSLLAVAQACQSLAFHQCDAALAGGVSITLPQRRGYFYQEGGMVSPAGTCRPFDAAAAGTVFGSGAGLVVLKRLADAVADGDRIYAVIKGYGVNNDGAGKVGFTAPSVDGQASCIAAALAMAGVSPETIGYVECHGTATPLGDPIEIAGLRQAFADMAGTGIDGVSERAAPCLLGSAKANLGHLDAAAGVTGLVKAALILHKGEIPPLAHFEAPNPRLDLASGDFRINTRIQPWPCGAVPRRAGVSAFGVGGTNVHLVLEEAPAIAAPVPELAGAEAEAPVVLALSAQSPAALAALRTRLVDHLSAIGNEQGASTLSDIARTLREGRHAFPYRLAVAAATLDEAAARLRAAPLPARAVTGAPRIVFMFPGQGAQYPGMAEALYARDAGFRADIDAGAVILEPLLGLDIRTPLLDPAPGDEDTPHPIRSTVLAQPALFLVEYALARLFERLGARPDAMIGHSLGEFTAACLAGVMRFEDALGLIAKRGRLMQAQPAGAMLSVRLGAEALRPLLPEGVAIAAANAPMMAVASGPFAAIGALEARLDAEEIAHRRLHTSHAFHSAMIEPVVAAFAAELAQVPLSPPQMRFLSSVTGTWITADEAMSHSYWAEHCRVTVEFGRAAATLVGELDAPHGIIFLEVGPGRALSTFLDAVSGSTPMKRSVPALPDFANRDAGAEMFAAALGALWAAGAPVDLAGLGPKGTSKAELPAYPFQRQRYWIDRPPAVGIAPSAAAAVPAAPPAPAFPAPQSGTLPAMILVDTAALVAHSVADVLEELQGRPVPPEEYATSFLNLGCDSLLLGQLAQKLSRTYGLKLTFRQLMRDLPSVTALGAHLARNAPADRLPAAPLPAAAAPMPSPLAATPAMTALTAPVPAAPAGGEPLQALLREQLAAMQNVFAAQLAALGGVPAAPAAPMLAAPAPVLRAPPPAAPAPAADEPPSRFQMYRGGGGAAELGPHQRQFLDGFVARYTARTPGSKARTQASRAVLADPRSASGFRAIWKEIVYPIVCASSKGARITDIDGNDYIDLVNGYGQTMFGHAPDFVVEAVEKQLRAGFAIGPQSPLAGEVAAKISRMTGNERVAFCNTGSEAVMAAMRIARAVTGRDRVVVFGGGYHGQFDEVLVKGKGGGAAPGALPIAPGIPADNLASMIVLPNGSEAALAHLRTIADDLAAVVVEPVQSRHPDLVPAEFLRELRAITQRSGAALIFDEVVTGFRVGPGGMQAVLDIRADLATYGKVLGGGMPIGVVAGRREFMDALDGGFWRYGDESEPEVAPTFFAGTFVRHPLALAAANAVLDHIDAAGPALYDALQARASALRAALNAGFAGKGLQLKAEHYASWLYLDAAREGPLASLLFPYLRLLGINAQEGFPFFLTSEHGAAEIAAITEAFAEATDALIGGGILASRSADATTAAAAGESAALPALVPLTEPQREILLAAQLGDAASMVFNESVSLTFTGAFEPELMVGALGDLVGRHDALRGRIAFADETLVIAGTLDLDVPVLDLDESQLADFVALDARTPFDLARGPLVRAAIARLSATRHVLVFTAHHLICDGWSMNVAINDLAEFYRARCDRRAPVLGPAASFRRYALEQREAAAPATAAYWQREFSAIPEPVDLPGDRPRPETKRFAGASLRATLDADLVKALGALARAEGVTLFSLLFAGVQTLVLRLSGQRDPVLTVPMAGQALVDEQDLVGHCVNFLPIRAPFAENESFSAHLHGVHARLGAAFDHQDYTLGTLVRAIDLPRNPNRTPLSDIQFNLEKLGDRADFGALRVEMTTNPKAFVNFDLFVNMIQRPDDIVVEVDYSTDLFDASTISRWIGHLRTLLAAAARAPADPVERLDLLTPAEIAFLRDELNAADEAFPEDRLIHRLFEAQVDRSPDAPAAHCAGVSVTYRQLDAMSNRLARYIRKRAPGHDQRIALALPRSINMLAALLAILKSGNAYVPLDPAHPVERLKLTMELADCAAIVTAGAIVAGAVPDGVKVIDLAAEVAEIAATSAKRLDDPRRAAGADPAAHIIFTSGSTGVPKGVEIGHRAVVNLLNSVAIEPGFAATDQIVAVTTVSFDIALAELMLPLVCGGATHIADKATMSDLLALGRLMHQSHASVLQATPSLWRALIDTGFTPAAGTRVISTGEPLPRDLAEALLAAGAELWNLYGPTETTIWSSKARITDASGPIPIGRPIGNTGLYVLDSAGNLAPIGVPGELFIGGAGLAHGYFRRPDLTAAAFVERKIGGRGAERLYRTGDLAMRRADGSLVHLGRRDHQVKLRGFRIELEEIEAVLRRQPGVSDAAVGIVQAGTPNAMLVATLVAAEGAELALDALKAGAGAALPGYMVPGKWQVAPALPRTGNGKLDRTALARLVLPELAERAQEAARPPIALAAPAKSPVAAAEAASEDPLLATITAVISAVLERPGVQPADRLFSLGANSLHIFRIAARLAEKGVPIDAGNLLTNPSVADLVVLARSGREGAAKRPTGPSLADFARARRRAQGGP